MLKFRLLGIAVLAALFMVFGAQAQGFMKIPGIPGESQRADHEGEIDLLGVSWGVESADTGSIGAGRVRGGANFTKVTVEKQVDASSPYLALSAAQGKAFDEVVISFRKDSGDAHLDYLVITLSNARISDTSTRIGQRGESTETAALLFEKIKIKYVVQADDHSAGDEHEIEYSVARRQ